MTLQVAAPRRHTAEEVTLLADLSAFLFHEASLLDRLLLEEWLELFTDDAVYWIPQGPDADPRHDVQLLLDDRRRMRERVLRLTSGFAYAQDPASRTVHLIGNVGLTADSAAAPPALDVTSVQLITEVRRNRQLHYAGRVRHLIVPGPEGQWQISRKEVHLVNGDLPLGNLTFLI